MIFVLPRITACSFIQTECVVQLCQMEPGFFRDCDSLVRNLQGRLEILAVSVDFEGETHVDHYDQQDVLPPSVLKEPTDGVHQLSKHLQKQTISTQNKSAEEPVKQNKCSTCDSLVGDAKQYRDHFKSEWHKHNLRRKTRQLPPLTAEECLADVELGDLRSDLKDYSF